MHSNSRGLRDLWQGDLQKHQGIRRDWDCRGDHGEKAASGVYYVVFIDGDGSYHSQKILVIR